MFPFPYSSYTPLYKSTILLKKMSTDRERSKGSKDCLSCRIISGITLTCAGLFIGYHGYRFKGYSQGGMLAFATVITGFGVARLVDSEGRLYDSFRTS